MSVDPPTVNSAWFSSGASATTGRRWSPVGRAEVDQRDALARDLDGRVLARDLGVVEREVHAFAADDDARLLDQEDAPRVGPGDDGERELDVRQAARALPAAPAGAARLAARRPARSAGSASRPGGELRAAPPAAPRRRACSRPRRWRGTSSSAASWPPCRRSAPRRSGTSRGTGRTRRSRPDSRGARERRRRPAPTRARTSSTTAGSSSRTRVDLGVRRLAREREAHDAPGLLPREPEREQRRRGRERAARAGASDGHGDALEVEPDQERLARRPGKGHGRRVRQPLDAALRRRARRGDALEDAALEAVAQPRDRGRVHGAAAGRRARPPRRSRRSPACSRCPRAAASPGRRRACAPRARRRAARRARPRPWGRASCAPRSRGGPRPRRRRRPAAVPPPAPRRCERGRRAAAAPRASSATGKTPPYSLLAAMTETSSVPGVAAARTRPGSSAPEGSGSTVTSSHCPLAASRAAGSRTDGCSAPEITMRPRRLETPRRSPARWTRCRRRSGRSASGRAEQRPDGVPRLLDGPPRPLSLGVDGGRVSERPRRRPSSRPGPPGPVASRRCCRGKSCVQIPGAGFKLSLRPRGAK